MRQAMTEGNVPFEEEPDEAAFYGPKIDVQIWSAIGREFTLATNQVDFAQPERLDLSYINAAGEEEIPLCIHRAPLSTHERMIGFLIEHYGGNFPVWLSPEQVRVIPVTSAHNEYAVQIEKRLAEAGARVCRRPQQRPHEQQDPPGPGDEGSLYADRRRSRGGRRYRLAAPPRRRPPERDARWQSSSRLSSNVSPAAPRHCRDTGSSNVRMFRVKYEIR